ncbi:nuclear transport factor 2 family protein [Hyalangium minutum]|nr:nuclear transport factor 2 family protein [Hyalangium minutum]
MREKNLQYLLDWTSIQDLAVEYGQAIDHGRDTGDWSRWANVFTDEVTADYTRLGFDPLTLKREQMPDVAKGALKAFHRVQHATANCVGLRFQSDSHAEVMAYAEVAHYFHAGGDQHEWTIVARYTFSVERTPDGWKIRKVLLDPIHYRGNRVGKDLLEGKTLI